MAVISKVFQTNIFQTNAFQDEEWGDYAFQRSIFQKNIEAEEFTIKVIDIYKELLMDQKVQLQDALQITDEKITVAYSSYKTASNSAALMSIMNDTQSTFNQIFEMQIPDIIPFENIELEEEFKNLSDKLSLQ